MIGADDAARNLQRFRSGLGGVQSYTEEEMKAHPAFEDAIDENRTRFEGLTFIGKTDDDDVNKAVLELKNGQRVRFKDGWKSSFSISRPGTYLFSGQSGIYSDGSFEATRLDNELLVTGTVLNRLGTKERVNEPFDFNPGQIGHNQATLLEKAGEARPFDMNYEKPQKVEARLEYKEGGGLTLKSVTWGPEE